MESIRTWYGSADIEVQLYEPLVDDGILKKMVRAHVEFSVDRVHARRSFVIKTLENRIFDENGESFEGPCGINAGLILDDVFYRYTNENFDANRTVISWQDRIPGSTRETLLSDRAVSAGSLVIIPGTGPDPVSYSVLENFDPMVWFEFRYGMEDQFSSFAGVVKLYPTEFRTFFSFEKQGDKFVARSLPVGKNPGRTRLS